MQLMWISWTPLVIIPIKWCEALPHRGLTILSHIECDWELQKRIPVALSVLLKSRSGRMTARKWCRLMCLQILPRFLFPIAPSFLTRFLDYRFSNKLLRSGRTICLSEAKPAARRFYNRQYLYSKIYVHKFSMLIWNSLSGHTSPIILRHLSHSSGGDATPPSPFCELNKGHDGYVIWRQRRQGCKSVTYCDCIVTSIGANLEIFHIY